VGLRTALLVAAALSLAGPAAAQTTVRSVRLTADLAPDDGGAAVRVEYVLAVDGASPLRFELLGFGDATAEGFRIGERETGTPISLETESGSLRAAVFSLGVGADESEFAFVAYYFIAQAVERTGDGVRVHVPVLTLALPPEASRRDVFQAELLLPESWRVSEAFPTGLSRRPDGVHEVDLPVVPSVVSLRARADGAWRPGLPLVLDVLAALILLGFGVVGWRHLREVAR